MKSYITINRLEVYARHGVAEQERKVGNRFEISATLACDISQAAATDDISLALNYAEVVDEMLAVMATPRNLLESVVSALREALCRRWPQITAGSITLYKVHPPFSAPVESVGVTLEW